MQFLIKNFGVLKDATFSLGDITIICGPNNTSKTLVSYAIYGFLKECRSGIRSSWLHNNDDISPSDNLDIDDYLPEAKKLLETLTLNFKSGFPAFSMCRQHS